MHLRIRKAGPAFVALCCLLTAATVNAANATAAKFSSPSPVTAIAVASAEQALAGNLGMHEFKSTCARQSSNHTIFSVGVKKPTRAGGGEVNVALKCGDRGWGLIHISSGDRNEGPHFNGDTGPEIQGVIKLVLKNDKHPSINRRGNWEYTNPFACSDKWGPKYTYSVIVVVDPSHLTVTTAYAKGSGVDSRTYMQEVLHCEGKGGKP